MLKIFQARLQQYVNGELPDAQDGFRKVIGIRDEIANIHWIIVKERIPEKKSISALLIMQKPLTVFIITNFGKFFKGWEYQTCLLRNLYAVQETTVRTGHGTKDWFQIGKRVHQGCILTLCLFNLYAKYIMRNPGLNKAQDGIKIARRDMNNLRYYAYDRK